MLERINLVPQKPFAVKIRKTTPLVLGVLLAVVFLLLFVQFRVLAHRISEVDNDIDTILTRKLLNEKLTKLNADLTLTVNNLRLRHTELQTNVSNISGLKGGKQHFSRVIARIAQALPPSIKCERISFKGNSGQISGLAVRYKDLPQFIRKLNDDSRFKTVTLQDVDRNPKNNHFPLTFNVVLELH